MTATSNEVQTEVQNKSPMNTRHTARVLKEVFEERKRQHAKFGEQTHPSTPAPLNQFVYEQPGEPLNEAESLVCGMMLCEHYRVPSESLAKHLCRSRFDAGQGTYADILIEELSEALAAAVRGEGHAREELVQVAAVAVAWIESIDRRAAEEDEKTHG